MGPPKVPGFDGMQQSNAACAGNTAAHPPPSSMIGVGPPTVPGFDGTQQMDAAYAGNTATYTPQTSMIGLPDRILRTIAATATLIAAIAMRTTKQTKVGYYAVVEVKTTGKGMSQLGFFIAANAIAFVYSAVSLSLKVANRGPSARSMVAVISVADLVMVGFVFSAVGSGAAFSVALHDNPFSENMCDVFDTYCSGIASAVGVSAVGAAALLGLVLLVLLGIHRESQIPR